MAEAAAVMIMEIEKAPVFDHNLPEDYAKLLPQEDSEPSAKK